MKKLIIIILICLDIAYLLFRPKNVFLENEKPKWSERYEDYVLQPHSIKLMFEKPKNNGFYVTTELKFSFRNDVEMKDRTK